MALQVALPQRQYRFEGEVPESCAAMLRRWPKTGRGGYGGTQGGKRRAGKMARDLHAKPSIGESTAGHLHDVSAKSSSNKLPSAQNSYDVMNSSMSQKSGLNVSNISSSPSMEEDSKINTHGGTEGKDKSSSPNANDAMKSHSSLMEEDEVLKK